jgi:hypothetical protein
MKISPHPKIEPGLTLMSGQYAHETKEVGRREEGGLRKQALSITSQVIPVHPALHNIFTRFSHL